MKMPQRAFRWSAEKEEAFKLPNTITWSEHQEMVFIEVRARTCGIGLETFERLHKLREKAGYNKVYPMQLPNAFSGGVISEIRKNEGTFDPQKPLVESLLDRIKYGPPI